MLPVRRVEHTLDARNKAVLEMEYPDNAAHAYTYQSLGRLAGVALYWDGKKMSVPARDVQGITGVQWISLRLSEGHYYGGINSNSVYRVISFDFGEPIGEPGGRLPSVSYIFWGGEYRYVDVAVLEPMELKGATFLHYISRKIDEAKFKSNKDKTYETVRQFLEERKKTRANKAIDATSQ